MLDLNKKLGIILISIDVAIIVLLLKLHFVIAGICLFGIAYSEFAK